VRNVTELLPDFVDRRNPGGLIGAVQVIEDSDSISQEDLKRDRAELIAEMRLCIADLGVFDGTLLVKQVDKLSDSNYCSDISRPTRVL